LKISIANFQILSKKRAYFTIKKGSIRSEKTLFCDFYEKSREFGFEK